MSVEFVFRLVGMVVFAIIGMQIATFSHYSTNAPESARLLITLILSGAAIGLLVAPYLTTRPFNFIRVRLRQLPISSLISGVFGLAIGLGISAFLYAPLSALPKPYGYVLPMITSVIFGYIGAAVLVMRQNDVANFIKPRLTLGGSLLDFKQKSEDKVLLDTSVIIDGRIADISRTGFLRSVMMVPHFVLAELQYIADSPDSIRRARGRRGLEILKQLQQESRCPVQITDLDIEGVKGADEKLVMLARQLDCPIVTNDFNLNSVAKLQGIAVLNINELANAVKTVILPSETINVRIIQEGKEYNQGIAYLNDGTMIVVESGKKFMDNYVEVEVTKVLQTTAGRMIFAKINGK